MGAIPLSQVVRYPTSTGAEGMGDETNSKCPVAKLAQQTCWTGLRMWLRGLKGKMTHLQSWNLVSSTQPLMAEKILYEICEKYCFLLQSMSLSLQPTFWTPQIALFHHCRMAPPMFSSCCAPREVLLFVSPAVILGLPLSALLLLHLSLPVAHGITFIPVSHPAPWNSPKSSFDALVSLHPLTIFLVSSSTILLLGRICRHVNPNPAAWHLWRLRQFHLPEGLGAQWGQDYGPRSLSTFIRARVWRR